MRRHRGASAEGDKGAEYGDPADEQTLDHLVSCGANLELPRPVQHYLECLSRSDVGIATLQLREAGYDASWMDNPTAAGFMVVAEREEVLNAGSIDLARSLLELIASRMTEARYDGWNAELRDDEEVRFDQSTLEPPSGNAASPEGAVQHD